MEVHGNRRTFAMYKGKSYPPPSQRGGSLDSLKHNIQPPQRQSLFNLLTHRLNQHSPRGGSIERMLCENSAHAAPLREKTFPPCEEPSPTRSDTISSTLADHLRHAKNRSHIISHTCLHHLSRHRSHTLTRLSPPNDSQPTTTQHPRWLTSPDPSCRRGTDLFCYLL